MILNSQLLLRRRRALGLTQRQLAKDLGVTSMVIAALEAGTNHHALSLAFVDRLAAALALDVRDLFVNCHDELGVDLVGDLKVDDDLDEENEDEDDQDEDDDVVGEADAALTRLLGALLFEVGVLTPREALAEAADAGLEDVDSALATLGSLIASAGLVLHHRAGDVALRPSVGTDPASLKRLVRAHHARRGLTLTEARMLRRIVDGTVRETVLSNPDRVALERLRKAGLVTEESKPQITSDVAQGLMKGGHRR